MKSRGWLLLLGIVSLVVVLGLAVKNRFWAQAATGALQVTANPKAKVWIDDQEVGMTRYFGDKVVSGERKVKLVAEENKDKNWEGWVKINPGIVTMINRDLAEEESRATGEVLSLEKTQEKDKGGMAVISVPDRAVVKIDGQPKGFTPLALSGLVPGKYHLSLASPGYDERTLEVSVIGGYQLIASVKLAQNLTDIALSETDNKVTVTPTLPLTPSPTPTDGSVQGSHVSKPYVLVKETPAVTLLGFLRIREDPSSNSKEIGRAKPGQRLPYRGEEKQSWYKISFEDKDGWVSGVYSQLVEE